MAARVALATVAAFLRDEARSVREVTFVLYDGPTHRAYADALDTLASDAGVP
jgi:O-acetyl-ADP-ribose deacetylase (regulator of RNase III)